MVAIDGLPVYEARLESEGSGIERVSLVDYPAVESDFLTLARQEKVTRQMFAVQDEERRLVRGVVARADFPIYRRDAAGVEYYVVFTAETIRAMAERFLDVRDPNAVNLMHEGGYELTGVKMLQWFIKDTAAGVSPAGFEDIADGSLFAEYHVLDDDIWAAIKGGVFRGFSLEGMFDLVPMEKQSQQKNNMSKIDKIKETLRSILTEMAFRTTTTDRGVLQWEGDDDIKVGDAVVLVSEDGVESVAADGEYTTTDGTVIVIAEGVVSEIREVEADEDAPAEEPTEDEVVVEQADDRLQAIIDRLDAIEGQLGGIETLRAEVAEVKAMSVARPADEVVKERGTELSAYDRAKRFIK